MIVRCSNCQTQFSLDDGQVGPDGAPVRCSVCAYVFRVDAPTGQAPLPWQVRTVEDLMWSAADLGTLRSWISEGRLHPDDKISRTGKHWIRLGDMPEFSDAFGGFSDLPVMMSPVGGPPGEGAAELGPPPEFGSVGESTGAVVGMLQDSSQSIDVSGLFGPPPPPPPSRAGATAVDPIEDEPTVARPAPERDDVVVRRKTERPRAHEVASTRPTGAEGTKRTSDTARVHRDDLEPMLSEMEDSGAVKLPPPPPPPPAPPSRRLRDMTPPEVAAQPIYVPPEPTPPPARASSMLGAVTAHVRPITSPPAVPVPTPLPDDSEASEASRPLAREPTLPPRPFGAEGPESSYPEPMAEPRRRSMWPLFAGLGLLCGAAVVFGVPQIRERVLGGIIGGEAEAADPPAVLDDARAAIASGDPKALEGADAELTKALASSMSAEHRRSVALALVEVLSTRALVFQLQAGLEGEGSTATLPAADAAERAGQVFAGADAATTETDEVGRARARLRLAQGRPADEILALVPADDEELKWLVTAAPMWRDPKARVPSGLTGGLEGLSEPSVPARLVLALAYLRGGDEAAAEAVLTAVDGVAQGHPVAALLRAELTRGSTPPEETKETKVVEETKVDVVDEKAIAETKTETKAETKSSTGGDGSGLSVDALITRGCAKVDSGQAKDGLALLLKAFDRRPNDIDVLVCLADAQRKLGSHGAALRYYDKALARSPQYAPALLGAARSANRAGQKDKAATYYRRLLAVSPGNGEAKAYLAEDKPKPKPDQPPPAEGG